MAMAMAMAMWTRCLLYISPFAIQARSPKPCCSELRSRGSMLHYFLRSIFCLPDGTTFEQRTHLRLSVAEVEDDVRELYGWLIRIDAWWLHGCITSCATLTCRCCHEVSHSATAMAMARWPVAMARGQGQWPGILDIGQCSVAMVISHKPSAWNNARILSIADHRGICSSEVVGSFGAT